MAHRKKISKGEHETKTATFAGTGAVGNEGV
jgi:hypothetical protein